MTNIVPTYKVETDDFKVEYEVLSPIDIEDIKNPERRKIVLEMQNLDNQINAIEAEINKMDVEIDRLTNHADGFDYAVAVASGILTGLIDSFFVGKLDLQACHDYGSEKIENRVKKLGGNSDLKKAIQNLEEKTKKFFPSDSNTSNFGGPLQHHLRDFAHHPTVVGLVCSILTQFTELCYGTDTMGAFQVVPVKDKSRIGDTVPKKIIYGTIYWFIHLVSDMAGSNKYAGGGTGLPGPILSLAKELSALPFFKKLNKKGDKEISVFISKLFNGTLFAEKDASGKIIKESIVPIDLRTEIGILHKQAMPVIINECVVRTFYAIRRFGFELREHPICDFSDLKNVNWKNILPFRNRTVIRMLTIAAGTFTAVDIADAAIRSGGFNPACLLRVNFVGVGRFAIAIVTDVGMGIKRNNLMYERINALSQQMALLNAKVSYKCAEMHLAEQEMHESEELMWISAQSTEDTLNEVYQIAEESVIYISESLVEIQKNFEKISQYRDTIDVHNKGLKQDIINIAKWGKK